VWIVVTCAGCGQTRFCERGRLVWLSSTAARHSEGATLTLPPCDGCAPAMTSSSSESTSDSSLSGYMQSGDGALRLLDETDTEL